MPPKRQACFFVIFIVFSLFIHLVGSVEEDRLVLSLFFIIFFIIVFSFFSLDGRCCRGPTCGEGQHRAPPFGEKMMLTMRRRWKGVMLILVMMLMNARLMIFTGYYPNQKMR